MTNEVGRQNRTIGSTDTAAGAVKAAPAELAPYLEGQLDAMGDLLRADVDARLRGLDGRGAGGGWWRWRHDALGIVLLGGLLYLGWQVHQLRSTSRGAASGTESTVVSAGDTAPPPAPTSTASAASPSTGATTPNVPADGASAPAQPPVSTTLPVDLDDAQTSWRAYLSQNQERLPAWATQVAAFDGPGAEGMSQGQRQRFAGYAEAPADAVKNPDLFLKGIFELALRSTVPGDRPGTIDLDLREYDAAAIGTAAERLGIASLLADPPDPTSPRVWVAVAVAWLERD